MDKRTLTALKGSIAKWEEIVNHNGIDRGIDNCPLCQQFYLMSDDYGEVWCADCPVYKATGQDTCEGTPYEKWGKLTNQRMGSRAGTPERKAAAQEELDFLKSLLPQRDK